MKRSVLLAVVAALLLMTAPAFAGDAKAGRELAAGACGRCHALDLKGNSPNPKAPPFRKVVMKYPLSSLEEALAEGIVVGHKGAEMPQFEMEPGDIDDLMAHLNSLKPKPLKKQVKSPASR